MLNSRRICRVYMLNISLYVEKVKLAGQQAQDLVSRVQILIAQKEEVHRTDLRLLRVHSSRTAAVRSRVAAKTGELRSTLK